ncbi:hypothetical protein ACP4OV_025461 [Aristida adscensionis]
MPVAAAGGMDSGANSVGESVGESPAPASEGRPAEKVTKGRGLRRWRRIPREQQQQHHEGSPASPGAAAGCGAGAGEDLAAQHKRRLGPGADAPKGKEDAAAEVESSVASVESSFVPAASVESSFVPPEASPPAPAPTRLDPNLGFLIATAGFSVGAGGADSENSDDRTSKSTAASAARGAHPRHEFSFGGFGRERDRARSRAPGAAAHGKNLRAARARGAGARAAASPSSPVEAENSRSSVESNLRGSSTAHARQSSASITSNGVHKALFPDDHHSDEEPPSEELRRTTGGFYKENGSVLGRFAMGNCGSNATGHIFDEASVDKFENGGIHSGLDPYIESVALLQSAQEALENELQKFVEIRRETDENSNHSETEWSSSPHDEPVEDLSEELKFLESKLEDTAVLINKKESRILELDAVNQTQPGETVVHNSNLLSLESDIDQLLLEKMEAETQCFILTRALQDWEPLAKDQVTLYQTQKSLSGDDKPLEVKLRHTESRAMMLEEMVEKLETQCKELSETADVLRLQARASKASLFCSIQLVLLCIAMGTLLMRFFPSSPEFVPT